MIVKMCVLIFFFGDCLLVLLKSGGKDVHLIWVYCRDNNHVINDNCQLVEILNLRLVM